jgi:BTB/POZ domain-containing protein KCTD9
MEKKLQKFLDEAFTPYGDFPARADVTQELLANLLEKFNDLKKQGKSDGAAYQMTVDSFGDVSEIMEQVPHDAAKSAYDDKGESSLYKTIVEGIKEAAGSKPTPKASVLTQADLTDTDLAGKDFSMSALVEASFDRADLRGAKFKAAALSAASFVEANLRNAVFSSSDLQNVNFNKADLTDAKLNASALKGATFVDTKLVNTEFSKSDLSGISFDGLILAGVIFNSSSLKKASFSGAVLRNVSFHHAAVKHAIFDGATMDKLTYALLKGAKATLKDVVVQ